MGAKMMPTSVTKGSKVGDDLVEAFEMAAFLRGEIEVERYEASENASAPATGPGG